MKDKLDIATNVVLIALACLVGYRYWQVRPGAGIAAADSVKVGDQLPTLPAYDWKTHDSTLVLALKNGCRFCEESIPFYRNLTDLANSSRSDVHLIAVFPDDAATVRQHLETQRLAIEAFPGVDLTHMKVEGTPTLILVDRQGRVSRVWVGELEPAGQADVVAAISKANAKQPRSAAATLPPS